MSESLQDIGVKCPVCSSEKTIKLPHDLFAQKKFGNIKVQVPSELVCEHPFIIFLDNKGKVRGYERIDIQFELAGDYSTEPKKESHFSLKNVLTKWSDFILYHLLHGYIYGYPTYIASSNIDYVFIESLNKLFSRFSPLLLGKTNEISSLYFEKYDDLDVKEKDSLMINPDGYIIRCPWTGGDLEVEREMVRTALEIIDIKSQNIIIEKEIEYLIIQAEKIIEIVKPVKSIYDTDLIKTLSDVLMQPKISTNRLNALKEFIARKYDSKLPKKIKNKVGEFLKML